MEDKYIAGIDPYTEEGNGSIGVSSGERFKITLNRGFFDATNVLQERVYVRTGEVVVHNAKWYHKLLNKLSFGLFFDLYYTYEVKTEK